MGILNAKKRFGIPASASMLFNLGSIIGGVAFAFLLAPGFLHDRSQAGRAMVGMAIGTLIGGAAQWLIQVPSLRRVGYRYEPILDWHDPGLRHVMNLLGPSVIGVAAVQINVFVNNWFASYFENGAVSWLNCAFRLMQFPIGLFGVAIATAALPTVSAHVARGDIAQFRTTLSRAIRLAMFPLRSCRMRLGGAGAPDHRGDLPAWTVHAGRDGANRALSASLCHRAGGLRRHQGARAGVLRVRRLAHADVRGVVLGRGECDAEFSSLRGNCTGARRDWLSPHPRSLSRTSCCC